MKGTKGLKKLHSLPLLALILAIVLSGTGLVSAFAAFVISGAAQSFVSRAYEYSWSSWEDEEEITHNESVRFDCYPITSGYSRPNSRDGIAVAWHNEKNAVAFHTPVELRIPSTLQDSEGTTYDVVAIHKTGFRYCDFATISMPNEVAEIGEEAFAYCQNLTSFALPYNCKAISPSMLMDCRNLETFTYHTAGGGETNENDQVTSVGDHAFMNCVKLKRFDCPTSLVSVGDSAFQKCIKITQVFFPKTTAKTPAAVSEAKRISIGDYAFADCELLAMVFFDVNVWSVGEYAFAHCSMQKLSINYTGSDTNFEDPTKMAGVNPHWRDRYTAMGNSEKYSFTGNRGKIEFDATKNYPGLYYTIDADIGALRLDQSTLTNWQAKMFRVLGYSSEKKVGDAGVVDKHIDQNAVPSDYPSVGTKYATIIKFDAPSPGDFAAGVEDPYYAGGVLKIPDAVPGPDNVMYPVRVIDINAFKDHGELTSVTFCKYLVQIRHWAFLGCDNIATLNFDACDDLLEISYEVFHSKLTELEAYNTENRALHTLELPQTLKYVGAAAFYNFTKVTSFTMSPVAVFFGQSAFENLGAAIDQTGTVSLTLPNTLRDGPVDNGADLSKGGCFGFKIYRYTANTYWDEAIQKDAFKNAKCLRSVTMAPISSDVLNIITDPEAETESPLGHNTLKPYRIGIQINAFDGCSSLVRFEASKQLYVIGKDAFANCTSLKEMFLTTLSNRRIENNGTDPCPWGFDGSRLGDGNIKGRESSIFGATSLFTDLVIYIDDPNGAPLGNGSLPNNEKWNKVGSTYPNQFSTSSIALVPTHAGVVRSDVKYYVLSDAATINYTDSVDFTSPCVSFIKKTGDYTITRCYCSSSNIATVDMSKFNEASSIKTIGYGAFAQMEDNDAEDDVHYYLPGRTVVLPSSVTTIEDRAFYRDSSGTTNTNGVQIVTYKDGSVQEIEGKDCYCILPPSVTSVGRLAFYNNCFESIYIKGNLSYLGNTAFNVFPFEKTSTVSASSKNAVDSISLRATQDTFEVSATNGGLYYNPESDPGRKTLIYQPGAFDNDDGDSDNDGELRIDAGTKAVGARACANTTYTSLSIPNSLTTIYGGAFNRCLSLGSVSFGNHPGLKYIGAKAYTADNTPDPEGEIWSGSSCDAATAMNDNPGSTEIGFADYHGAFYKCGLAEFNFTALNNSLVKVGYGAFEGCDQLTSMTGGSDGAKYTYYKWPLKNGQLQLYGSGTTTKELTSTVLDLSGCSKLRAIGFRAFKNCSKLKFAHLPNNYNPGQGKALYLGSGEPESGRSIDQKNDETIFSGCTLKILVGEKCATAYIQSAASNANRYPQKTFDGNRLAYYHAEGSGDLVSATSVRYWYELDPVDGVRRFVLLDNKSQATEFFSNEANKAL